MLLCVYEFDYFRFCLWARSCAICPSMTGSFHSAYCPLGNFKLLCWFQYCLWWRPWHHSMTLLCGHALASPLRSFVLAGQEQGLGGHWPCLGSPGFGCRLPFLMCLHLHLTDWGLYSLQELTDELAADGGNDDLFKKSFSGSRSCGFMVQFRDSLLLNHKRTSYSLIRLCEHE